jgi:hypothetical protein
MLLRAALGVAFVCLVVGLHTPLARAADDDTNASAWSKFMQTLGLKRGPDPDPDINFTERSPLVVPPSRDLPPPVATAVAPTPDWPKDPNVKPHKHVKAKPAAAPAAADASAATASPGGNAPPVQAVPNPPFEKRTWYNPATWFNKEEYATFTGEPARDNLTDPPTGYRTPSPAHPYGIGPDNKTKPKTTAGATTAQTGTQAAPPAAPQPVTPTATQPATPSATQPVTPSAPQPESQAGK